MSKIVFDFENVFGRYWGVPLATLGDLYSIRAANFSKLEIMMSKREFDNSLSLKMSELSSMPGDITINARRPLNSNIWYSQFIHNLDVESDFFYTYHFPALKSKFSKRIIRIHDPFSFTKYSFRELFANNSNKNKLARFLRTLAFNLVKSKSLLVCNSEFTAKKISEIYEIPGNQLQVVPYGFEWKTMEQLNQYRTPKIFLKDYFLMICGLRGHKRPDLVINFWSSLSNSLPNLVVVGSVDKKYLSDNALKQKKAGRLIFYKNLDDEQIMRLKVQANAMIFASLYEGFGRPVIEALLAGVPSIANNISVFQEISMGNVDFFDLTSIESIEQILMNYKDKISHEQSKKLIENVKAYSYENVGEKWKRIIHNFNT